MYKLQGYFLTLLDNWTKPWVTIMAEKTKSLRDHFKIFVRKGHKWPNPFKTVPKAICKYF